MRHAAFFDNFIPQKEDQLSSPCLFRGDTKFWQFIVSYSESTRDKVFFL